MYIKKFYNETINNTQRNFTVEKKHIISLPPGHVLLQLERQPGEAVDRIWATKNHACYVAPKIPHETKSSGASYGVLKNFSCSKKGFFLFFQSYIDYIYIYISLEGLQFVISIALFTSGFGNTEYQGTEEQHGSPTTRDKIPTWAVSTHRRRSWNLQFSNEQISNLPSWENENGFLSNLVKYSLAYWSVSPSCWNMQIHVILL